jgi:hypothetical protein
MKPWVQILIPPKEKKKRETTENQTPSSVFCLLPKTSFTTSTMGPTKIPSPWMRHWGSEGMHLAQSQSEGEAEEPGTEKKVTEPSTRKAWPPPRVASQLQATEGLLALTSPDPGLLWAWTQDPRQGWVNWFVPVNGAEICKWWSGLCCCGNGVTRQQRVCWAWPFWVYIPLVSFFWFLNPPSSYQVFIFSFQSYELEKYSVLARRRWLMPVILATREAEIRKIEVRSRSRQTVHKTLSQKKPLHKKGLVEWLKV